MHMVTPAYKGADVGPATTCCLGVRERSCRKLRNRRSARAAACPSVSLRYPGLLSDRARSGHGVDPQRMTAAPCRDGPRPVRAGSRLALGFWPEGVQRLRRSRVAGGHFRRKREASLTVEGHPRTLSGPSPDPGSAPSCHSRRCGPGVIVRPGSSADSCQRDLSYWHRDSRMRVRRAARTCSSGLPTGPAGLWSWRKKRPGC
jgi:hypothetical protein